MNQCEAATGSHAAILYTGLYLVALGTSGVKAALPALGADQFDDKDPKEASKLSSFFNWFLFSLTSGAILGVTFIVWISTNKGWDWSFTVSTLVVLFSIVVICMGKSLYRNNTPKGSPLIRIIEVNITILDFFFSAYFLRPKI
jgi:peptide/histidine transporter 3/4